MKHDSTTGYYILNLKVLGTRPNVITVTVSLRASFHIALPPAKILTSSLYLVCGFEPHPLVHSSVAESAKVHNTDLGSCKEQLISGIRTSSILSLGVMTLFFCWRLCGDNGSFSLATSSQSTQTPASAVLNQKLASSPYEKMSIKMRVSISHIRTIG